MKEKILTFFRKLFRQSAVIGRLLAAIVPIVLYEIRAKRLRSDAEVRAFVIELVTEAIAKQYPGYEFLIDTLVEAVVNAVRDQLRRRAVN